MDVEREVSESCSIGEGVDNQVEYVYDLAGEAGSYGTFWLARVVCAVVPSPFVHLGDVHDTGR